MASVGALHARGVQLAACPAPRPPRDSMPIGPPRACRRTCGRARATAAARRRSLPRPRPPALRQPTRRWPNSAMPHSAENTGMVVGDRRGPRRAPGTENDRQHVPDDHVGEGYEASQSRRAMRSGQVRRTASQSTGRPIHIERRGSSAAGNCVTPNFAIGQFRPHTSVSPTNSSASWRAEMRAAQCRLPR